MTERFIYLSGPITGLIYEEAKAGWRARLEQELWDRGSSLAGLHLLSPMRNKEHLRGTGPMLADGSRAIIARDLMDIRRSDLVVLHITGATRVSIGSMIELGYATALGKPILLIWDDERDANNPHNHGWLPGLVTHWVSDVQRAADWIINFMGL